MRIVVIGGRFGGVTTVRDLERFLRRRSDVEISRENFFVLTPLLFEACSDRLELPAQRAANPHHAPLRALHRNAVESVDLERQLVRAVTPDGLAYALPFDHLVVASGRRRTTR